MYARRSLLSFLCLTASLLPCQLFAQRDPPISGVEITPWSSTHALHVLGMPDVKAKDKGTLTVSASQVSFTGKSARSTIELPSIVAISAGQERVELWGVGGRLLRMAVPDGGGVALATFMHHRRDALTVDFLDGQSHIHSAVFYLPGKDAEVAVRHIKVIAVPAPAATAIALEDTPQEAAPLPCALHPATPGSVLVLHPTIEQPGFPASYRGLLYEHIVERLRRVPETEVHRDGNIGTQHDCTQYTIRLATTAYKAGNQVKRASLGPIGMFVGATQIKLNIDIVDASGATVLHEETKATQRGESESVNVVDTLAKQVVKKWTRMQKDTQKAALVAKR